MASREQPINLDSRCIIAIDEDLNLNSTLQSRNGLIEFKRPDNCPDGRWQFRDDVRSWLISKLPAHLIENPENLLCWRKPYWYFDAPSKELAMLFKLTWVGHAINI